MGLRGLADLALLQPWGQLGHLQSPGQAVNSVLQAAAVNAQHPPMGLRGLVGPTSRQFLVAPILHPQSLGQAVNSVQWAAQPSPPPVDVLHLLMVLRGLFGLTSRQFLALHPGKELLGQAVNSV